mgnify:CR=1 FL=1
MEKVKEILLAGGKAALDSAVELGRSVVQLLSLYTHLTLPTTSRV